MPSLEITALEHPEHAIAERPAAQAVDERIGSAAPSSRTGASPKYSRNSANIEGVALRRAPRPFLLLNKSNISLPFHSNITLPIWCLLEDPLSDSVSELPCSG